MANHIGNEGYVKVGGNTVAEMRSWSVDMSVGTIDDTVTGDTWDTHKTIQKNWTASAEVFWDETDTAQIACEVGASVTLALYPEGVGSGASYRTGTATVEKLTIKGSHNGMVEASMSFKGNGILSLTTV